ncbi:uncharacterized protein LOC116425998 isoform X3 [Nomia melanderi]|uniref:uncharacterized protein LOC116425998 isoform X3 n=1 Tax=Nomia melanderi TaxID=2448451 RepID=UPI003FCCE28F
MFVTWGDWFTNGVQSAKLDTQSFLDSVIITNNSITKRIPLSTNEMYKSYNDPEIQRYYWAAPFLLPIGAAFILALLVLLMVLFKRCPHIIVTSIISILGALILFGIQISIKQTSIYI